MAAPSNRSPSPLSTRPTHQSRNSDSSSAARRSFSGNNFTRPPVLSNPRSLNPVTPANSPAGFGRKNCLGLDGKENEKDQTPKLAAAARSPANGSKSFMAPTISAASKFTPSPRKKVLVERNDPVRTSISLSDGKATFFSAIASEVVEDLNRKDGGAKQKDSVLEEEPPVSKTPKRVRFLEELKPETVSISSYDFESVDSVPNNTPCLPESSPIIAPLDADPSIPPYDPKTNFLSPRPQFLHYKPNPRIHILPNEENELEDNFMLDVLSENFSDTDGTEGSSISEDSQKGSEDSSSYSDNSLPEGAEEELLPVSESLNTFNHVQSEGGVVDEQKEGEIEPISHGISEGNLEQEKEEEVVVLSEIGRTKSSFFKVLKSVSLLLLLFVACVSVCVTISPSMDASVLDTLEFGARFHKLSFDSFSHLSLLINKLGGGGDNLGNVQFINLTYLEDDDAVCKRLEYYPQRSLAAAEENEEEAQQQLEDEEPTFSEMVSDDNDDDGGELEDLSEPEIEEELVTDPAMLAENFWDIEEEEEASFDVETELKKQENSEEEDAALLPEKVDDPQRIETHNCEFDVEPESTSAVTLPEKVDDHPERIETHNLEGDVEPESSTSETVHSVAEEDTTFEMLQDSSFQIIESPVVVHEEEPTYSVWEIASIVSALVSAVAAAAFIYWKKQSISSSNPTNVVVHTDNRLLEKSQYKAAAQQSSGATEIDLAGEEEESCSSEMSSFRRSSSSYSRNDEVRSQDSNSRKKKYSRRESLASSSEFSAGSSSYGSFTTYERISNKHASGDHEILTPVRRSSRIRNHVTSP